MTRAKALKTLADEIRFFENEGFPVAVWITSLGYGRMTDPDFLRLCTQPLAGILLAANGAPTRYDRDTSAPLAVFGPAAVTLPEAWLSRGVVLDYDGAAILRGRGIDMEAADDVLRIGGWCLYRNVSCEVLAKQAWRLAEAQDENMGETVGGGEAACLCNLGQGTSAFAQEPFRLRDPHGLDRLADGVAGLGPETVLQRRAGDVREGNDILDANAPAGALGDELARKPHDPLRRGHPLRRRPGHQTERRDRDGLGGEAAAAH